MDVEELLRETAAPTMSVAPDVVLREARSRGRRRRNRWIGAGAGLLAAAAAVAITVSTTGPQRTAPRPLPAHSSAPTNTLNLKDPRQASFFGPSAGLPLGEIASSETPIVSDAAGDTRTPASRYVVTRQDGVLRLSRLDGSGQTLLPLVEKLPDGGSVTKDRKQTLTVHPLPTDVRSAEQITTAETIMAGGGTTMPDGSKVGVFWTGDPVPTGALGIVWWLTTTDGLGASSGEPVKTVSMAIGNVYGKYWEFTKAGVCGMVGTDGLSRSGLEHGQCGTGGGGDSRLEWLQTVDGPISDLKVTAAAGAKPVTVLSAQIDGTSRWVLWGIGTGSDSGQLLSKVTWRGPDGKQHTWDGFES